MADKYFDIATSDEMAKHIDLLCQYYDENNQTWRKLISHKIPALLTDILLKKLQKTNNNNRLEWEMKPYSPLIF